MLYTPIRGLNGILFFPSLVFYLIQNVFKRLVCCVILCSLTVSAEEVPRFKMHRIDMDRFEACCVADFNNDGKLDIVAGEYLYLAPDWKRIKIREIESDIDNEGK